MSKGKDIKNEIETLRNDLEALENLIFVIIENLDKDPQNFDKTNKVVKNFLRK